MQTRRIAHAPGLLPLLLLLLLLLPLLAAAQAQAAGARQAEQARRDAAVADETQAKQPAAPSYGPVLTRRDAPGTRAAPAQAVPGRKDPAEVHDETDTLMRHEPQPSAQPPSTQPQQQPAQPARRRPGAQATAPMAPRPLRSPQAVPPAGVPVPPPAAAPQPVVPSSTAVRGCQGGFCTDAGGNSFSTDGGAAGVNSSGRLCTRSGATVQCF